jgi:hypothetical protein
VRGKRLVGAVVAGALATATNAVAATPVASGSLPTVAVTLTGKTVSMSRTVHAGAISFSVTVHGEKLGVLGLIRLQPGVSLARAFTLVQSHRGDPNALAGYASVVADIGAPQGTSPTTMQTILAPGRYAAVDFAANGRPPARLFTVTGSSAGASLPRPGATITEQDFAFDGPAQLHDGELVRFQNHGDLVHMAIGAHYLTRAAAEHGMALLKGGHDRTALGLAHGFVDFMDSNSPGAMQQEPIAAEPGFYVLACVMDTTDGREHTQLGMLKLVRITK